MRRPITIGLVTIGGLVWERRPSHQYRMLDGSLVRKGGPASASAVRLAYLPYVAGLLQAHVERHAPDPAAYRFLPPVYLRLPIDEILKQLRGADVVGFSIYVWNVQLSLLVARRLKELQPDVTIVFGGPQVPDDAEQFLRTHSWVDVVCHGEGEQTFLEILERQSDRQWGGIRSVSYLDASGAFWRTQPRPRMQQLDEVPSPFLNGVFDDVMAGAPQQQWLVTWETNRGCPFSCAFCDWGSATASRVNRFGMERLLREIEWFADRGIHHMFICDANFGLLPRDVDLAEHIAQSYLERSSFVTVHLQNTKNRTDRSEQIQRALKRSGVVSLGASLSLQSVSPNVLKAIQRDNIDPASFERLQKYYAQEKLDTYTDLIIGLPDETYDSFADGVAQIIRTGQHNRIAFYECSVLPNAPMAQPDYRLRYGLETTPVRLVEVYDPLIPIDGDNTPEFIDLVVASKAMSREEWVRARVLADFAELLFFDRMLQIVMLALGEGRGWDYRRMLEAFIDADDSEFPLMSTTRCIFEARARAVLQGEPQFIPSQEWLGIWWPADQYAIIGLARAESIGAFYEEALEILTRLPEGRQERPLIEEAVRLNEAMFAVPFAWDDLHLELSWSVASFYLSLGRGEPGPLINRPETCTIRRSQSVWLSWDDWCEDLVRRLYVRRAFLWDVQTSAPAFAGTPVTAAVEGCGEACIP
ncbi:MAG TPA: radical SAM protein [Planctomycetaceae bacterium]|jgi:radical SAM superfamily enzyme YgiQ (UPF0313 family)